jgi:hypothetical protein
MIFAVGAEHKRVVLFNAKPHFRNTMGIWSSLKAKEIKKCHHRQLMSADAVEFCQL